MDINDAWNNTCRVLLGGEVGELKSYEKYLTKYVEPIYEKTSALSGKKVIISRPTFCRSAKFISNDEMEQYASKLGKTRLDINDIKDLDSILGATKDAFCYAGNHIVGNSKEVYSSDLCENANYIFNSSEVYESKYIAYCNLSRNDEYMFGSNFLGESKFCIKSHYTHKLIRSMETLRCFTSNDCYYCANMEGCSNCLFSFNQRNKQYTVGNNQFTSEEYAGIKDGIVSQMRDSLKLKKTLPMIVDILRD